jgi:squalene synthase HpnC
MPSTILAQLERFGPDHCEALTVEQASAYAVHLVHTHYENFSVLSRFLPKPLRPHFAHVYAFCRWADDLGDETGDTQRSLDLLNWWRTELDRCYLRQPRHPVFVALLPTIEQFDIPRKPFDDLINAFIQDQHTTRYESFEQLVDYCTRSADPVGRLVLYMAGHRDEHRQQLSDATCTALQLANFWQDVRRDILERDRVYIPADVARRHNLDLDLLVKAIKLDAQNQPCSTGCSCSNRPSSGITAQLPAYRATLRELVDRTWPLFRQGRQLWPLVHPQIQLQLKLFTFGGESILRLIRRQNYNTATTRPTLSKPAKAALMFRAVAGKMLLLGRGAGGTIRSAEAPPAESGSSNA